MKFVIVFLVVGVVLWLMLGRFRGKGPDGGSGAAREQRPAGKGAKSVPAAQAMLTCVHCGVHLPSSEALADAQGRLFCSEVHRLAGPAQPPAPPSD